LEHFWGEVVENLGMEISFHTNSPDGLFELLPKFQQGMARSPLWIHRNGLAGLFPVHGLEYFLTFFKKGGYYNLC